MVGASVRGCRCGPERGLTRTEVNPEWLSPMDYAAFLSRGFRESWNQAAYEWYIARPFNGVSNDLIVRAEGSRILAGVTLCYREVAIGNAPAIKVCIASAGATLPDERRRGHYGELLQATLARCQARSCAAILGFVTRDNGSGRGLSKIGALSIPSFYIMSPAERDSRAGGPEIGGVVSQAERRNLCARILASRQHSISKGSDRLVARFYYANEEDWIGQFLSRPNPVRAVRLAHDSFALVETVGNTDRLQWLSCPDGRFASSARTLARSSSAAGRRFFSFTADALQAQACKRAGLKLRGGYLMLQPTGCAGEEWRTLSQASWHVQAGDRL